MSEIITCNCCGARILCDTLEEVEEKLEEHNEKFHLDNPCEQ